MSTVDIDKQVREIITRLFTYGVDWTEHRDKGGPNGDHDVATYAAKIKADFANEIANELVQLFAAQRTTLKAELLAKLPQPYRSPNELDPKAPRDIYAEGISVGEKRVLYEITKIVKEL